MNKHLQKGFTLVEIMIVVAIIGLLAAIAIPSILRARVNANEGTARESVRAISTALETYRSSESVYPGSLDILAEAAPPYLDGALSDGVKQGYTFSYEKVTDNEYSLVAEPETVNVTGENTYFVDQTGVIRKDGEDGDPIE